MHTAGVLLALLAAATAAPSGLRIRVINATATDERPRPPIFDRPPSPSYLIATAAFGSGKIRPRSFFVHAVADMCSRGMYPALLVDVAGDKSGLWETVLLREKMCDEDQPQCHHLYCGAMEATVQIVVRHHPPAIRDLLTAQHVNAFRANLDRFDWFFYAEDDLGWTPASLTAFSAELGRLRAAAAADPRAGGLVPGFVRWEPVRTHVYLNYVWNRTLGPRGINDVPLGAVAGNDVFWRVLSGAERVVEVAGERYVELRNPFQACWLLPRDMLRAAWAHRVPLRSHARAFMVKEFFGGGWMYRNGHYGDRTPGVPARVGSGPSIGGFRKVVPCARFGDFLTMHMSMSKYTISHRKFMARRYTTLRDFVEKACAGPRDGKGHIERFAVAGAGVPSTRELQPAAGSGSPSR